MKKIVSLFAAIVMTVGIMSAMPLTVNAASKSSSDGLDVSMETSTNSYALNEDEQNIATEVEINVNVKNTNATDFTDVEVKLELPSGLMLKTGDLVESGISVPSGKTHKFTATAIHFKPSSGGNDDNKPTNEDDNPTNSDDSNEKANTNDTSNDIDSPKTGDSFSLASVLVVMLFSASLILVAIRRGMRIPKGVISLGLCLAIVAGAANITVFAAESSTDVKTITVDHTVTINDTDYTIKVTVSYSATSGDDDGDISLSNFNASECDIYIETPKSVIFTVNVSSTKEIKSNVCVYNDREEFIGNMNDDGVDGDATANDGVYSAKVDLTSSTIDLISYYASCKNAKSNSFEICFYRDLTENEFASFSVLLNKINSMNFEQAKAFVSSSSEITDYHIDESNKTITYDTVYNIGGVWEALSSDSKGNGEYSIPSQNGIDYAAASDVVSKAKITPKRQSNKIVVLRPFRSSQFKYDDFKTAGNLLKNGLKSSMRLIDDFDVSLDAMKTLDQYDIVLIDSHGGSDFFGGNFIVTGQYFDENAFLYDVPYYLDHVSYSADYIAHRIRGCSLNRACVFDKFFKKYYQNGSLNNSFWFLGICKGLEKENLANALLSKGAQSIVGFTDTVSVGYCNKCLFETVINSMLLSADTVSNSVQCARNIYGDHDPSNIKTRLENRGSNTFTIVKSITVESGTLSGKVCKASDRVTPISGAVISVYQDSEIIKTLTSNESGNYSIVLPVGDYKVKITAEGYMDFEAYAKIKKDETNYMETFLMVAESEATSGVAKGKVTNTLVGSGVEGVTLTFKPYWNNTAGTGDTVGTAVTDANGYYTAELPLGNYTAIATKSGFLESTFNIVVQEGTTDNQNGTITPIVSGDDFRITLTWGENPRDLDSHVEGTLSSGSHFHVYFSHKSQYDGDIEVCNLDYDDTTSYGPEHITLKTTSDKPYYYYIHRWAGSGTISSSSAKIQIHQGSTLIKEFNVPTSLGSGDYWNVFAIVNGRLVVRNTMTSSPETSYINADGSMVRGASTQNLQGSSDNMTSKETTSDEVSADSQTDAVSSSVESSAPESTEATVVSSEPASVSTEDVTSATEESSKEEYPISSSEDTAPATPKTQNQTATVPAQKEEADDVSPSDTNN